MGFAQAALPLVILALGETPGLERWIPPPPPGPARVPVNASLHPRAAAALARTLEIAEEKLAASRCREIFADFKDLAGRPLDRLLEETGRDAIGVLRGLDFVDGTASFACRDRRTLAWTHPGARTIHLCSAEFAETAHATPRFAANVLIHESLHSLGLGENPPASLEITEHVGRKCGY